MFILSFRPCLDPCKSETDGCTVKCIAGYSCVCPFGEVFDEEYECVPKEVACKKKDENVDGGVIAGAVVGVVLLLASITAIIFLYFKNKQTQVG